VARPKGFEPLTSAFGEQGTGPKTLLLPNSPSVLHAVAADDPTPVEWPFPIGADSLSCGSCVETTFVGCQRS
jgi:hypothetical protein